MIHLLRLGIRFRKVKGLVEFRDEWTTELPGTAAVEWKFCQINIEMIGYWSRLSKLSLEEIIQSE